MHRIQTYEVRQDMIGLRHLSPWQSLVHDIAFKRDVGTAGEQ